MENCTIYSHKLDFDKVITILQDKLPKSKIEFNDGGKQKSLVATIKGGFFSKTFTLKINYRERLNPSYKLDKVECGLTQNLGGMVNFIQSLPASNEEVKTKFLHKVMAANCEMAFIATPYITSEIEATLRQIVTELDAFVFAQPNNFFQSSEEQHFVDKDLNLILDTAGNCNIQDIDVIVDAKYHDQPSEEYTQAQLDRKEASEAFLTTKGIKTNVNLPCQADSSTIQLRSTEDIITRAYALLIVAAKGEGIPSANLEQPIADKQINNFTPKEHSILNSDELTDQEKTYATWRYESLYTLLWAINLTPQLKFPDEICDVQDIVASMLRPSRAELTATASLRSTSTILDELDKTYRMHWACVDARIKGEPVTGGINPSIIYERHYAMNWLINYQNKDWDDVLTHT